MKAERKIAALSGTGRKKVRMIDMHAHLSCLEEMTEDAVKNDKEKWEQCFQRGRIELKLREENSIFTCFSAGTLEQWNVLRQMQTERVRAKQTGYRQTDAGWAQIRQTDAGWAQIRQTDAGRAQIRQTDAGRTQVRQTETRRQEAGESFLVSFGIHPWYAERYDISAVDDCLSACDLIGEIGMDSVWCEVPLSVQQKQFERQLRIAADLKKPVVLHTKGQEQRIAEIIRDFPGKICVHWYSGDRKNLEKFMERDCYFTLGPDTVWLQGGDNARRLSETADLLTARSEAAQVRRQMVQEIPAERLFVETDGIGAVAWAKGVEHLAISEIPAVLRENMEYTAVQKNLALEMLEERMIKNLLEFLCV